jgi:hypothetical protein
VEGVNHPDITPSTALLLLANRPKNQDATRLDAPAATRRSRKLWVPQGRQPATGSPLTHPHQKPLRSDSFQATAAWESVLSSIVGRLMYDAGAS